MAKVVTKRPALRYRDLSEKLADWNILQSAEKIARDATVAIDVKEWMYWFFWFKRTQKSKGLPATSKGRDIYRGIIDTLNDRGLSLFKETKKQNIDISLICGFTNDAFISSLKEIEIDMHCVERPMSDTESKKIENLFT